MLRSFHYASYGSLLRPEMGPAIRPEDVAALDGWVRHLESLGGRDVPRRLPRGHRLARPSCPSDDADWAALLDVFLLEKACYELTYELNNRPEWVAIPIRGILQLLGG